jgi:predicted nuclease with TOPRIM domain
MGIKNRHTSNFTQLPGASLEGSIIKISEYSLICREIGNLPAILHSKPLIIMQKKESNEKTRERLSELYDQVKEFEARAKELRAELDEEIEGIKNKDGELYRSLEDLKYASSAAFYDVRQGFEKAADAIRDALKKASHHFK